MAFVDYEYFFYWLWEVAVDHIIPLVALLLMAILVPRLGRLTIKIIEGRLDEEEESTKARLALLGALVYVVQIIAYFVIILLALSNLGVPPLGAAVPATIVSAAVGFGAQSIIGDFLAGFFIISERQFGVGDYVSFDGTSTATEGTVVALTLRATKVRTPSGEVVMIPNGSAGVVTNYSQDWSRAVVNFEVPVRSGENLDHIQKIIEDTSNSAVKDSSIAEDVAGEIEILPATSLTPPTAAGQPWKVNFRILVVVNPARQWAVERGIRSALLNVFWDHFRTPFETPQPGLDKSTQAELAGIKEQKVASPFDAPSSSTPPSFQGADAPKVAASDSPTEVMPVNPSPTPEGSSAEETQDAAEAAEKAERTEEELAPSAKDDGPGRPAKTATFDATDTTDSEDTDGVSTAGGAESDDDKDADKPKGLKARRDFWRTDAYDKRWKKIMSFGGRIRVSTTGLILALLFTGGLALASSNPEDGNAGILSPAYWRDRAETTVTETTEPEVPLETSENEPTVAPEVPEPSEQPLPSEEVPQEDTQLNNEEEQSTETSSAPTQQNPGTQNQQPTRTPTPSEDAGNQGTQGLTDTGATSQSEAVQVPEPADELIP
ncbi:mechanosensitive ion channel family protein [Corynebacterium sp.]|uniref:mechanosensitive ion channel family protein n=1 Tax=Corynebacterium sp. TaxID=1720 RepID=UPI0028A95DDB|nr:mechanosensitive ion channel family protein [Corynebacterium sp.]